MIKIICDQCGCECTPKSISLKQFDGQELNYCSASCFWKWIDERNCHNNHINEDDSLGIGDSVIPVHDGANYGKDDFVFIGRSHDGGFICVDKDRVRHIFKEIIHVRSKRYISNDVKKSRKKNDEIKVSGWTSKCDFKELKAKNNCFSYTQLPSLFKNRSVKSWDQPPVHVEVTFKEINGEE